MKPAFVILLACICLLSCRTQTQSRRPFTIAQAAPDKQPVNEDLTKLSGHTPRENTVAANAPHPESREIIKSENRKPVRHSAAAPKSNSSPKPAITTDNAIPKKDKKNHLFALLLGAAVGIPAGLALMRGRKRKIRLWAAKNKIPARFALVGLHSLLASAAYVLGSLVKKEGIEVPDYVSYAFLGSGLGTMLVYPFRNRKSRSAIHQRRRSWLDTILIVSGFMAFVALGSGTSNAAFSPEQTTTAVSQQEANADAWQIVSKIMLTIISVAVAIIAAYLVVLIACGFYCSNMQMAGHVVLFGGGALVVAGLILVIRQIWRKRPPKLIET